MHEGDSFQILLDGIAEAYEKEACEWVEQSFEELPCPRKPLNAYQVFQNQEVEGRKWDELAKKQKKKFLKDYDNRLRKYHILNDQFKVLTMKKNIPNAYTRFYRKMYTHLEAERKHSPTEMTVLIKQAWGRLPQEEKTIYQAQEDQQLAEQAMMMDQRPQKISSYRRKLQEYDNHEASLKKQSIVKKRQSLMPNGKPPMSAKKLENKLKKEAYERQIEENIRKIREMNERQIAKLRQEKFKAANPTCSTPDTKGDVELSLEESISDQEAPKLQKPVEEKIELPGPSSLRKLLG